MFIISRPTSPRIEQIQSTEQAYYFSQCAAGLLRKHGLIGVCCDHDNSQPDACTIVLRQTDVDQAHNPNASACFEGPLAPIMADALSISVSTLSSRTIMLRNESGVILGRLCYPDFTVRRIPATRWVRSKPYPFLSKQPYWNNRTIRCQTLTATDQWRPVLTAQFDDSDEQFIVGVSDGHRLVLGVPLFDLLAYAHASPPLDAGYYALTDQCDPWPVETWLIDQLINHAVAGGTSVVQVQPWPDGFTAAFSVRHDYDRLISDAEMDALLAYYESRSIRSSWGFLVRQIHAEHANQLIQAGHEVLLHTEANSESEFLHEVNQLQDALKNAAIGYTSHGGTGSAGYLGQTQFPWAEQSNMKYGEMLGRQNMLPHRANIAEDSTPQLGELMLPPIHFSLDAGTKPDAHFLETLREQIPPMLELGGHVVVMNHPDIHIQQLQELIDGLDLSNAWRACVNEIMKWFDLTHFTSRLTMIDDEFRIEFQSPLPRNATVKIIQPDGEFRIESCPAGRCQYDLSRVSIPVRS